MEPQHRFSAQLREVGHIEVRAPIGNKWDPETWNGDTWEDALGDLEFPGSPEPQGPAEVTPPPYEGGAGFVNEQDATSSSLSSERPCLPAGCPASDRVVDSMARRMQRWAATGGEELCPKGAQRPANRLQQWSC